MSNQECVNPGYYYYPARGVGRVLDLMLTVVRGLAIHWTLS